MPPTYITFIRSSETKSFIRSSETKSNTVPILQKLQGRNNEAPLHIHTPRVARNRKEVQSIKSALSSIFRKQLKEEPTYKSQVDIFPETSKARRYFRTFRMKSGKA